MRNHTARWLISVPLLGMLLGAAAWAQPAPRGPQAEGDQSRPRERMRQRDGTGPARPAGPSAGAPTRPDRIFDALDANQDGKIDREELARRGPALKERLQGRRQAAGGPEKLRQGRGMSRGAGAAMRGQDAPWAGKRQMQAGRTGQRGWQDKSAAFAGRVCGRCGGAAWSPTMRGPGLRVGADRPGPGPRLGRDADRPGQGAGRGQGWAGRGFGQGRGWQGSDPQGRGPQDRGWQGRGPQARGDRPAFQPPGRGFGGPRGW
jgi:hypothetical protein